jgi:D-alanyl-D-alanine carboxypeptidase
MLLLVLTMLTGSAGPAFALAAPSRRPPPPKPAYRPRTTPRVAPAPPPVPAPPPGPDGDPIPAPLGVDEGILVDSSSGKVLWAQNETFPRPPASLTKILTAIVVLQHARLDDTQVVTQDAYDAPGSNTYAKVGETLTVEDLLWGLLLASGNDMAVDLAHKVSPDGTVGGFVNMMNQEASALGAQNSSFANPHGMDAPGHYSTARDIALMTMVAMRNPTFAQMVGTTRHEIPWGSGQHLLVNHNKMLTLYPGTTGVKTGYTNGSGNSLVTEATRNGMTLLTVVLGSKSPAGYNDSMALLNWGFANFGALEAKSTDQIVPVKAAALAAEAAPGVRNVAKKSGSGSSAVLRPAAAAPERLPETRSLTAEGPERRDDVLLGAVIASLLAALFITTRRRRARSAQFPT